MGSGNSGGRQEQQQLLLLLVALSAGVSNVQHQEPPSLVWCRVWNRLQDLSVSYSVSIVLWVCI